ncbi:MAG: hypothetical protein ACE5G1_16685, partial [bacterium]
MKAESPEKVRFVFFSTSESEFRQFEFNLRRAVLYFLVASAAIASILFSSFSISNRLFENEANNTLVKTNVFLKKKIKGLQSNIDKL